MLTNFNAPLCFLFYLEFHFITMLLYGKLVIEHEFTPRMRNKRRSCLQENKLKARIWLIMTELSFPITPFQRSLLCKSQILCKRNTSLSRTNQTPEDSHIMH